MPSRSVPGAVPVRLRMPTWTRACSPGSRRRDAGGLDGTGAGDVDAYRHRVAGQDRDGARVDDGGLDALGAGGVQQGAGGAGGAQGQRPPLGDGLEGEREDVQGGLARLGRVAGRQGEGDGLALRVDPHLGGADSDAVLVLAAVRLVAVRRRQRAAHRVPVAAAQAGGGGRAVGVVDGGPAGGVAVAAGGEEDGGQVVALGEADALAACDNVVLGARRRGGEVEGDAVDLDTAGREFLARERVAGAVEVTASGLGGVDAVVVVEGVERYGDRSGDGDP
ncbi:hypothetical protein ABT075_25300 [Streptomyces sp. NPDC002677]|uniref:hypothetical protein n=1 Tax=Streptomyces sp. NPDC002677 TaxID=3154774 RepID=UPI00331F55C0